MSDTGECVVCQQAFRFNADLVPTVLVNGVKEPICQACAERANAARMEPKPTLREVWGPKGIPEAAWRVFDEDYSRVVAAWEQDTGTVGRILRGHLFVEHFLTEHLAARNPNLGPLNDARLSFAQKLALVGRGTEAISDLLPGLRRLNAIRNRLAHSLHAEVTAEDAEVFLSGGVFRAMRDARDAPGVPSTEPLDVLEDFAKHAGLRLHHSCSRSAALWTQARRRAR